MLISKTGLPLAVVPDIVCESAQPRLYRRPGVRTSRRWVDLADEDGDKMKQRRARRLDQSLLIGPVKTWWSLAVSVASANPFGHPASAGSWHVIRLTLAMTVHVHPLTITNQTRCLSCPTQAGLYRDLSH